MNDCPDRGPNVTPGSGPPGDALEEVRRQFDQVPFPNIPLETSAKTEYNLLFSHALVTPYYLRHQIVPNPAGKLILDAGCGTGFNALVLAEANPGAKIVGIDISSTSVQMAQQRLDYHRIPDAEFHVLPLEELPSLGMMFDYINCDETLYLIPDPLAGLRALKAVLKPRGILRFNLHSLLQRRYFYRGQALFRLLGLPEGDKTAQIQLVIETMEALREEVVLKQLAWKPEWSQPPYHGQIAANLLLSGDKGFRVADLFNLLAAAGLDFISMVNWRHWDVTDLFHHPDNIPTPWAFGLEGASPAEKLHLYELVHPVHRLLDCWCTHPGDRHPLPVEAWQPQDWQGAIVHLHPQLQADAIRADLIQAVQSARSFEISRYIQLPTLGTVSIQRDLAATLLPLWSGAQPFMTLVERYCQIQARHPLTLEPMTLDLARQEIQTGLTQLHPFLYVLLEHPGGDRP